MLPQPHSRNGRSPGHRSRDRTALVTTHVGLSREPVWVGLNFKNIVRLHELSRGEAGLGKKLRRQLLAATDGPHRAITERSGFVAVPVDPVALRLLLGENSRGRRVAAEALARDAALLWARMAPRSVNDLPPVPPRQPPGDPLEARSLSPSVPPSRSSVS